MQLVREMEVFILDHGNKRPRAAFKATLAPSASTSDPGSPGTFTEHANPMSPIPGDPIQETVRKRTQIRGVDEYESPEDRLLEGMIENFRTRLEEMDRRHSRSRR